MEKRQFLQCLKDGAFQEIFQDLGWNAPLQMYPIPITLPPSEQRFDFYEVAQLGVRVFVCETERLPLAAERNMLDARLRKFSEATYITIFIDRNASNTPHHLWMVPVKTVDKRSLVTVEYTTLAQADFLYAKLTDFSFPIGEVPNVLDVIDGVNRAFVVNSATVTKKFYQEFKKKHTIFENGIQNITEASDRDWYASVMLNRLMFCYFIQKKGFLDLDQHYLRKKLKETQKLRGKGQFYGSFYREFLRVLFVDGLNQREQTRDFKGRFGRIPYLNGGMFEEHLLEKRYPEIDIPDEVFETLFNFFDEWNWHLDTSITASGKDINPDVLGYIFEQYINDRAQMGAYYTKEDITEYIARNTILPWLFNETAKKSPTAFKPNGEVWEVLRKSGDACIFAAVRKGIDLPLPPEIEKGVDTTQPDLRKRRVEWNKPTAETHALPTEIWRETVARRLRCQELREKIAKGEISDINDLITYNLDIRKFAEIVLANIDDHLLIKHFYDALSRVTILDPTCGSGAFLFAALNILEPLYEICLTRMQEVWPEKFKNELDELRVKYRGNLKYCIYKNIILRNLYGVDIMREATEIARLRLFLKMVAVVDVNELAPNLGLDPLPDIDFNIRCGNTLVGFVNPDDVKKAILPETELAYGNDLEAYKNVEIAAQDVAQTYKSFKTLQLTDEGSADYYATKARLNSDLNQLNDTLDRAMAERQYDISPYRNEPQFKEWKQKTQPFHWYSEFYDIVIGKGGFDVIIGNPPYVEYSKVKDYKIKGYKTESCGNLYAYVIERSLLLSQNCDRVGFVVPLTISSNNNMQEIRELMVRSGTIHFSHYETRPSRLFEGADQRLTIFLISQTKTNQVFSTPILRWSAEYRDSLFSSLHYGESVCVNRLWRMATPIEIGIFQKMNTHLHIGERRVKSGSQLWYRTAGVRYWIIFNNLGFGSKSLSNKSTHFNSLEEAQYFMGALNSNLFWWYYAVNFDMFNLKDYMIFAFPLNYVTDSELCKKSIELENDLLIHREVQTVNRATLGYGETYVYKKKKSKQIIDQIDELLAQHYGFTEEELDFIINYDIKYRMGDKLNDD